MHLVEDERYNINLIWTSPSPTLTRTVKPPHCPCGPDRPHHLFRMAVFGEFGNCMLYISLCRTWRFRGWHWSDVGYMKSLVGVSGDAGEGIDASFNVWDCSRLHYMFIVLLQLRSPSVDTQCRYRHEHRRQSLWCHPKVLPIVTSRGRRLVWESMWSTLWAATRIFRAPRTGFDG